METSFQIASDLHIEYKNNRDHKPLEYITPSAPVLILAGDIGSFYKLYQLIPFLEKLSSYFEHILYIPGNHEYYSVEGQRELSMKQLRNNFIDSLNTAKIDNVQLLDRSSVKINNICIVGCTLWSDARIGIPPFICRVPELRKIDHNKGISGYNITHNQELKFIKKMIKYCKDKNMKLLVVTHHPPTYKTITKHKKRRDRFKSLYASDLDYLLNSEDVDTWVAGHIHENFDFISEGGTHLVGNQLGKPKDKIRDYKKNKIITL